MKITIKIYHPEEEDRIYAPRESTIKRVLAECEENEYFRAVLQLGIEHFWGKNCFFWRDNGLLDNGIFGQVCEPLSERHGGGNNCVTPRIRIIMRVNGHDVCNGFEFLEAMKDA